MLKKLKYFVALLMLTSIATPAMAEKLEPEDMAFAFASSSVSDDSNEIALLSHQEMIETQGELRFLSRFNPHISRAWRHVKTLRVRGHYDAKPHRFSNSWGPLRGNRPHYQLTFYKKGISGSHWNIRIPWGSRTTWGNHRP